MLKQGGSLGFLKSLSDRGPWAPSAPTTPLAFRAARGSLSGAPVLPAVKTDTRSWFQQPHTVAWSQMQFHGLEWEKEILKTAWSHSVPKISLVIITANYQGSLVTSVILLKIYLGHSCFVTLLGTLQYSILLILNMHSPSIQTSYVPKVDLQVG